ncbi:hypothetical protein B9Z55_021069 [Caenorhabditis nigoni]|uniref:SPK domain-containing protein n=1 Tax=Caenorhabditis nigoni TaxID=1611254 RepID=A0A2G5TQG3_9PELO|nr:hypothetical protein B9Z55_021069 [Caenorhabditis nigoni]
MSSDMSDVIRFISERIVDYDKPEYLSKWAGKAMKEFPSCRYAVTSRDSRCRKLKRRSRSMSQQLGRMLNKVEKMEGYSLMEKLQLAFIFSRPVSDEFVQKLKDAKFEIEQDEKKRISRFSTEDGNVVRFSDHNPHLNYFEGVLCLKTTIPKKKIYNWMPRKKEQGQQDVADEDPNSEEEQSDESIPIEPEQDEINEEVKEEPVEDISIEQEPNQQLVKREVDDDIDFGGDVGQGAFSGRINYEELDNQELVYPGFPGESKPETSTRLQKRHQSSTTDSGKRVKTEEMESESFSSNSIATSSNQKTDTGF